MFRLGGSAENEGIMNGMRKRYEQGSKPEDIDSTYTAAGADFKPTNQRRKIWKNHLEIYLSTLQILVHS